jgi:NAD+ kinase
MAEYTADINVCNIALSYGGDGTLLSLFRQLCSVSRHGDVLIAGYNKGTVGFMANDMPEEDFISSVIQAYRYFAVKNDNRYVQKRYLLMAILKDKQVYALNEISIHPSEYGKLFVCDVYFTIPKLGIDKERITYKGDGLILSTTSGSTAYNLSAGGPLLLPTGRNMTVTPICPFSLADRSIVLSGGVHIRIDFHQNAHIVVDGQPLVNDINSIDIKLTNEMANLYKCDNFFETIQSKLGWNHSIK